MSAGLVLNNVIAYSLQIGMLVALAAFVPALLRLRQPGVRLAYWHILLAACLLLPMVRPWRQEVIAATVQVTTVITAVHPGGGRAPHGLAGLLAQVLRAGKTDLALAVLSSGVVIRLVWLAVGFLRLRRYRRRSHPLDPAPSWSVEASLHLSDDVASPVTFGWRRPVVLLPAAFPAMDGRVQDAVLCHEILHVRRKDWLITVIEEVVRAVFWFHPAIWWLLGEIGLAREQEVDRQAIAITKERDEYMDALLAIAGSRIHLDLAPAPLFLRKRHLRQRVVQILKETRMSNMSKTSLISAFAAGITMLAAACWLVTGAFPLMAAPQLVSDAPGVTVDLGGATVLHRTAVPYPLAARQLGVQGNLSVEVRLDTKGNVVDAHVLSGPDELRKAALESVLQWHFTRDSAGGTRVVQIAFELPKEGVGVGVGSGIGTGVGGGVGGGVAGGVAGGVSGGVVGGIVGSVPTAAPPPAIGAYQSVTVTAPVPLRAARDAALASALRQEGPCTIKTITVLGLPEEAKNELMATLPVHEGDACVDALPKASQAARDFDEHLQVRTRPISGANDVELQVVAPGAPPAAIKVGGVVQAAMVIKKVQPLYPELAKAAHVEGVVHLAVIIDKDGTVREIRSMGGPALLVQSAMDAVKQWVYKVTLLNGNPVEVETTVDVNFALQQ